MWTTLGSRGLPSHPIHPETETAAQTSTSLPPNPKPPSPGSSSSRCAGTVVPGLFAMRPCGCGALFLPHTIFFWKRKLTDGWRGGTEKFWRVMGGQGGNFSVCGRGDRAIERSGLRGGGGVCFVLLWIVSVSRVLLTWCCVCAPFSVEWEWEWECEDRRWTMKMTGILPIIIQPHTNP